VEQISLTKFDHGRKLNPDRQSSTLTTRPPCINTGSHLNYSEIFGQRIQNLEFLYLFVLLNHLSILSQLKTFLFQIAHPLKAFIHSGYFYSAFSCLLLLGGDSNHIAAGVGFKPATLRTLSVHSGYLFRIFPSRSINTSPSLI